MNERQNIEIVRGLAKQVAEIAADPVQEERRQLWSDHFSLKTTRPPIVFTFGHWNCWYRDYFADEKMECDDPFWRGIERNFRHRIFHHGLGDDFVQNPWHTMRAAVALNWGNIWGLSTGMTRVDGDGTAGAYAPPIQSWDDMEKLTPVQHEVDEESTAATRARLEEAFGDILEIDVDRTPALTAFLGDIATEVTKLRGLEQIMIDMYEAPEKLHELLAFLRDAVLTNQQQGEDAGHFTLSSHNNQALPYCDELEWPAPNSGSRNRQQLWGFFAAQEYTLISPEFHDRFLLQYQLPIIEKYGLIHYGCCEDLGRKIDMLRQIKNLRSIAVTPVADVRSCAEQIGTDYAISWRPNPTDMVSSGTWNEELVRRIIADGLETCKGQHLHIHLKDVETVGGDISRLGKWVKTVRQAIEQKWDRA